MVLFLFSCESYRRRFECFAVRNQGHAFPELLDLLRRKQSVEKLRREVVVFLSSNPPFFRLPLRVPLVMGFTQTPDSESTDIEHFLVLVIFNLLPNYSPVCFIFVALTALCCGQTRKKRCNLKRKIMLLIRGEVGGGCMSRRMNAVKISQVSAES